jgi:hypothetical protein
MCILQLALYISVTLKSLVQTLGSDLRFRPQVSITGLTYQPCVNYISSHPLSLIFPNVHLAIRLRLQCSHETFGSDYRN